jgi:hypothetical protein
MLETIDCPFGDFGDSAPETLLGPRSSVEAISAYPQSDFTRNAPLSASITDSQAQGIFFSDEADRPNVVFG